MRIRLLVPLALLALALALPASASARVRCGLEERGIPGGPGDALTIRTTEFADAVAIFRDGDRVVVTDDRRIKPVTCAEPEPTVTSIDSIELVTEQEETSLYLELAGGLLRPGATPEDEPWSEIELEVAWPFGFLGVGGRRRADVLRFGELDGKPVGDMNGDGDADVEIGELGGLLLRGRHGDDVLSARGGDVLTLRAPAFDPLRTFVNFEGGPGDDALYGGPRRDFISGGGGQDLIEVRDGVRDDVDCGAGRDLVDADERDRLRDCERVDR